MIHTAPIIWSMKIISRVWFRKLFWGKTVNLNTKGGSINNPRGGGKRIPRPPFLVYTWEDEDFHQILLDSAADNHNNCEKSMKLLTVYFYIWREVAWEDNFMQMFLSWIVVTPSRKSIESVCTIATYTFKAATSALMPGIQIQRSGKGLLLLWCQGSL